jgi:hypothetical protein
MVDETYLARLHEEYRQLREMWLWRDFVIEAMRLRAVHSRNCEVNREDVRFSQGIVQGIDDIFGRDGKGGILERIIHGETAPERATPKK